MLKPLTLSLSLALALSVCGVSKAGGMFHGDNGCTTCGIASPQGPAVSPQASYASPQVECAQPCKPKCSLFSGMGHKMSCGLDKMSCGMKGLGCGFKDFCGKLKPKPPCYKYEWVLKKKKIWGCHGACGSPACETCAVAPSGQGAPSFQAAGSPQAGYSAPAYGTGQIAAAPAFGTYAPAMIGGDEAPPAPAAPGLPSTPSPTIPAPPAPPTPGATSGLLFSTPSGN